MKIAIATGGTGGHIFPAFAMLEGLEKNKYDYLIIADQRFERFAQVYKKPLNYKIIQSSTLVTGWRKIISLCRLFYGTLQALTILVRYTPNVVLSFGGYPAFPTMLAAKLLRIPILVHEPNSVVGRANKFFLNPPNIVSTSFDNTVGISNKEGNVYVTGTPVRADIVAMRNQPYNLPTEKSKINILIIGGSQGASILSMIVPQAILSLDKSLRSRIKIFQQCREKEVNQVQNLYAQNFIEAEVNNFFVDMAQKLADAHLVIGRAGANTIAELIAVGRPAILVPLPTSKDDHQLRNAQILQENKACFVLEERDLTQNVLAKKISDIFANPSISKELAEHSKILYKNSSEILLNLIEKNYHI